MGRCGRLEMYLGRRASLRQRLGVVFHLFSSKVKFQCRFPHRRRLRRFLVSSRIARFIFPTSCST